MLAVVALAHAGATIPALLTPCSDTSLAPRGSEVKPEVLSLVRVELTGVLTIYHNVTKISEAEWLAVGRVMLPADTHELWDL